MRSHQILFTHWQDIQDLSKRIKNKTNPTLKIAQLLCISMCWPQSYHGLGDDYFMNAVRLILVLKTEAGSGSNSKSIFQSQQS